MTEDVANKDGVDDIQPDKDGKYPENVSWSRYVGVKEAIGKKLDAEKVKVKGLEEQLKNAVKQDEFNEVKKKLDEANADKEKVSTELNSVKTKGVTEKRELLKTKGGFTDEQVNKMSEDALTGAVMMLERSQPKLDLGVGGTGGGVQPTLRPMASALRAYTKN